MANNYHEILNERKPTKNKTEHTEIALEMHMKETEAVLIMQLSLPLLRLDKVICYPTFCDDQFICFICLSIFVISEVYEDSSLTGVGFFSFTYYYTYKQLNLHQNLLHDVVFASSCIWIVSPKLLVCEVDKIESLHSQFSIQSVKFRSFISFTELRVQSFTGHFSGNEGLTSATVCLLDFGRVLFQ